MYNSVVVGILVRLWEILQDIYRYSLLKRIRDFLVISFKKLAKGSKIVELFTSNKSLIEESLIYRLYCRIVNWINGTLKTIEIRMEGILKGSVIYGLIHKLFHNQSDLQITLSLFFIILGGGIMVINIFNRVSTYIPYLFSLALVIAALAGLSTSYRNILKGSLVFNCIKNIFIIDEGVDQWW
ncbi:MAG TPA: hypothetical protein GXX70_05730 [Tepidimicrobium sp.]|nr:hypothetical protein [Tepidimicrobium sp.]